MRVIWLLLLVLTLFTRTTFAQEQILETGVRDAFLISRIKNPSTSNKQPSQLTKNSPSKKTVEKVEAPLPKNNDFNSNSSLMGLGYTIYMRTTNDECVSIDPSRRFRAGDSIRVTFEPNTECFIYIFYVEGDGEPELLFPDKKLGDGNNKALAHVPFEIPSSTNPVPELRWFNFTGEGSEQKLYVVASKKILSEVPTGKNLAQYSQEDGKAWNPSKLLWLQLKQKAEEPVTLSKSSSYGQSQSKIEKESIGRRLSLSSKAPPPSVIQVNNSPLSDLLVTMIELIQD